MSSESSKSADFQHSYSVRSDKNTTYKNNANTMKDDDSVKSAKFIMH